jgi:cytochrome c oxidase subunit 4
MADHAHSTSHGHEAHADGHGHGGVGKYVAVFFALCILTAISFGVGNWHALRVSSPGTMWAIMMAVSCCKALLVILFFMHILWEANWKYVLTVPASLMSIFLMLMLVPDIGRRTLRYAEERWLHAAQPQIAAPHEPGGHSAHDNEHAPANGKAPTDGKPAEGKHGGHE